MQQGTRVLKNQQNFCNVQLMFQKPSLLFKVLFLALGKRIQRSLGQNGFYSGSCRSLRPKKNRGSLITYMKISFSRITKISRKDITCSYTKKNVGRKQNHEWLTQGSILQIAYLSHSPQTTLTIHSWNTVVKSRISFYISSSSRDTENLQLITHHENAPVRPSLQILRCSNKN